MTTKHITIIGAGRMGETLTAGLLHAEVVKASQITITGRNPEKLERFASQFGVNTSTDNAASVAKADIVLLCVKPQMANPVLASIAPAMGPDKVLISIMAGKRIASIEALAEGGVKSGLPRDVSTELAAQMTLGAAKMVIQTGQHPAILKDHVTTPGGCTIDGILKLEEGGLRVTLIKAVTEATKRACELG